MMQCSQNKCCQTYLHHSFIMKWQQQSNVYKPHRPMMQVMFGACLRVSETIGLTWSDVDMKNREIHVGGQLVYYEGDEGYCFHDSETL